MGDETGLGTSIKSNPIIRLLKSRRYWEWVLVVLVIVVSVTLFWLNHMHSYKKAPKADNGPKCSRSLLENAGKNLDPNNINQLQPIFNQITAIKGYDKDQNCLYVVAYYYVNISDATNARANFDKLDTVDAGGNSININSQYQGKDAYNDLKHRVESLEQIQKNTQDQNNIIPGERVSQ